VKWRISNRTQAINRGREPERKRGRIAGIANPRSFARSLPPHHLLAFRLRPLELDSPVGVQDSSARRLACYRLVNNRWEILSDLERSVESSPNQGKRRKGRRGELDSISLLWSSSCLPPKETKRSHRHHHPRSLYPRRRPSIPGEPDPCKKASEGVEREGSGR